jgi:hypothetical protein
MLSKKMVQRWYQKPWPIYKIKLGTTYDIAIVSELRKHTKLFSVWCSAAGLLMEAIKNAVELKKLGVEF